MENLRFKEVKIEGNDLVLRNIKPEDLPMVYRALSHPKVIKYYGVSFDTPEDAEKQMQWFFELEQAQKGIWLAIELREMGLIGAIGIYHLNTVHKNAELGFWLLPEFMGKGYMKKAINLFLPWCLEQYALHRLYAEVESKNTASLKVLMQCGFEQEGIRKECEWKNEKWLDLVLFAYLNKEQ